MIVVLVMLMIGRLNNLWVVINLGLLKVVIMVVLYWGVFFVSIFSILMFVICVLVWDVM